MHSNKWEDSLLVSKQSNVTCQYPSPLFLQHNRESDQIWINNKMPTAFFTHSNTVQIVSFSRVFTRDIIQCYCLLLDANIFCMQTL